jgi:2-polyprenyl-3-methyl-5-hydroxy-6-metoxy-1,4-benzoquinol methylase
MKNLLYNKNFFIAQDTNKVWQKSIGKMIGSLYQFSSVVDFGCGCGHYLDGFLNSGVKIIMGIEYAYDQAKDFMPKSIVNFVREGNLTMPLDCGKFDCSFSIEVAEHLPKDKDDIFIENLIRASNGIIILTAAQPGQRGGIGHINEQPKEYWIEKMKKQNFQYSQSDVEKINNGFYKVGFSCKYMRLVNRNIMVFKS